MRWAFGARCWGLETWRDGRGSGYYCEAVAGVGDGGGREVVESGVCGTRGMLWGENCIVGSVYIVYPAGNRLLLGFYKKKTIVRVLYVLIGLFGILLRRLEATWGVG